MLCRLRSELRGRHFAHPDRQAHGPSVRRGPSKLSSTPPSLPCLPVCFTLHCSSPLSEVHVLSLVSVGSISSCAVWDELARNLPSVGLVISSLCRVAVMYVVCCCKNPYLTMLRGTAANREERFHLWIKLLLIGVSISLGRFGGVVKEPGVSGLGHVRLRGETQGSRWTPAP